MASYNVPPDISEKEKIVGGLLTFAQLIWLIVGVGITAVISMFLFAFLGNISIIVGVLIGIPFGICFAFVKVHTLSLAEYLKLRRNHLRINKK
jgi:uncharacterized membrane protein YhiD involved in acid resistance